MPENSMPECVFCSAGNTFVVPRNSWSFHCNHCGGDFDEEGDPIEPDDEDEEEEEY